MAVKTVTLRGLRSWKVLELFEREARTLQSLRHPSIPRYRGVWVERLGAVSGRSEARGWDVGEENPGGARGDPYGTRSSAEDLSFPGKGPIFGTFVGTADGRAGPREHIGAFSQAEEIPGVLAFELAQDAAPGRSLASLVSAGVRLSERSLLLVARDLLSALAYLASRRPRVVHRDVSPANILIADWVTEEEARGESGEGEELAASGESGGQASGWTTRGISQASAGERVAAYLVDFGAVQASTATAEAEAEAEDRIAELLERERARSGTRNGQSTHSPAAAAPARRRERPVFASPPPPSATVTGTVGFMAPEHLSGLASSASDLYGLGASLLWAATGRRPAFFVCARMRVDLDDSGLGTGLRELLEGLLEPVPEDRLAPEEALEIVQETLDLEMDRGRAGGNERPLSFSNAQDRSKRERSLADPTKTLPETHLLNDASRAFSFAERHATAKGPCPDGPVHDSSPHSPRAASSAAARSTSSQSPFSPTFAASPLVDPSRRGGPEGSKTAPASRATSKPLPNPFAPRSSHRAHNGQARSRRPSSYDTPARSRLFDLSAAPEMGVGNERRPPFASPILDESSESDSELASLDLFPPHVDAPGHRWPMDALAPIPAPDRLAPATEDRVTVLASPLRDSELAPPAGPPPLRSSLTTRRRGRTLELLVPPASGPDPATLAFAFAWNGFVAFWTCTAATSAQPLAALFSAPFWVAGAYLLRQTFARARTWERLRIGPRLWSLERVTARLPWRSGLDCEPDWNADGGRDTAFSSPSPDPPPHLVASGKTTDLAYLLEESPDDGPDAKLVLVAGNKRVGMAGGVTWRERDWIAKAVEEHVQRLRKKLPDAARGQLTEG